MQADKDGSVTLMFFMMTSETSILRVSAIFANARFTGSYCGWPGSAVVQAPFVT